MIPAEPRRQLTREPISRGQLEPRSLHENDRGEVLEHPGLIWPGSSLKIQEAMTVVALPNIPIGLLYSDEACYIVDKKHWVYQEFGDGFDAVRRFLEQDLDPLEGYAVGALTYPSDIPRPLLDIQIHIVFPRINTAHTMSPKRLTVSLFKVINQDDLCRLPSRSTSTSAVELAGPPGDEELVWPGSSSKIQGALSWVTEGRLHGEKNVAMELLLLTGDIFQFIRRPGAFRVRPSDTDMVNIDPVASRSYNQKKAGLSIIAHSVNSNLLPSHYSPTSIQAPRIPGQPTPPVAITITAAAAAAITVLITHVLLQPLSFTPHHQVKVESVSAEVEEYDSPSMRSKD
ncbi:hypothetical protein GGR50DRAFT_690671 [Xylaria sp. CBS 124048]|nr:hypothetical protein GGR50DRAFT_690671 [Xylaria sp. CBS 124048]